MFLRVPFGKVERGINGGHEPLIAERHEEDHCENSNHPKQDGQFFLVVHDEKVIKYRESF